MIILVIATIYYAYNWYTTDTSGEAGFAIITGVLIPILFIFKNNILEYILPSIENKDILKIEIIKKEIRCYTQDIDYAIQIDLEIYAYKKTSIKNIQLTSTEPVGYSKQFRELNDISIITDNNNKDFLNEEASSFEVLIKNSKKINKFPIIIEESEHLILTISGYVKGERLPDGWEGLQLDGWNLIIEYNDNKKYSNNITLDTHNKTLKVAYKYKEVGFNAIKLSPVSKYYIH